MDTEDFLKQRVKKWVETRNPQLILGYILQCSSYDEEINTLSEISNKTVEYLENLCAKIERLRENRKEETKDFTIRFDLIRKHFTDGLRMSIDDQALDIYKNIKDILPHHELLVKFSRFSMRRCDQILFVSEDFSKNYNDMLDEIDTFSNSVNTRATDLILISPHDDEGVKDIITKYNLHNRFNSVIHNDNLIYKSDMIVPSTF